MSAKFPRGGSRVFFGRQSSRAVVSYWRKDIYLVLVNRLGSLPRNSVVRLTDRLDMTIVVDWDIKPQIKQTNKISWRKNELVVLLFRYFV